MVSKNIESNNENLTKKERKKLRLKNIILDGASELFLNRTYENVTMSDIADHVALSRATLYNYFGTKEEIFYEIGSRYARELIIKLRKLHGSKKTGLESLLSFYKVVFEDLLGVSLVPQLFLSLYQKLTKLKLLESFISASIFEDDTTKIQAEIDSLDAHLKDFVKAYVNYRKILHAEFQRGKEDGSILTTLDEIGFFSLMNIMIFGSGSFFKNFLIPLNHKWITGNEIIERVLNIVKSQLTDLT